MALRDKDNSTGVAANKKAKEISFAFFVIGLLFSNNRVILQVLYDPLAVVMRQRFGG